MLNVTDFIITDLYFDFCCSLQVETVEKLILARVKEREQLLKVPRRCCGLQPMPKGPEVLGKVMLEN